jgi:quercetin dioxygenase-like cupin family protein
VADEQADSKPEADAGTPLPVRVLTKRDLLRGMVTTLPGAETGGTLRTVYPGLEARTFRSTLIVVPSGQRSPARDSEIEHIILVLEGAFLFIVDGVDYQVEELDQIFVPVGVRWEYLNASLGQSMFLSMVGP